MSELHNDVYEKLGEISGQLKGINKNFNEQLKSIDNRFKQLNGNVARHNKEIAEIKTWKNTIMGKLAGITIVLVVIWEIFGDNISNFL